VDTVEEYGVKRSEITVIYRFSQPDAMPLVLPQSYNGTSRVVRIPTEPQTIGDHLRRRRLALKLLQREVAERLGVVEASIWSWEANTCELEIRYMPAIVVFLGYNPLPPPKGWAERLVQCRTLMGLTQEESAKRIGVDQGTLARWERGEREPTGAFAARAEKLLSTAEQAWPLSAVRTA